MSAPSFTYSGNVYTAGTAGATDFPLTSTTGNPIPYLEQSHIHVYKSADQGATWTELTRPAQWNFISSGTTARLAAGIASGEWVKVQRITPSSSSYVVFQSSSLLTAEQLNDDTLFNTYLNQERFDQGTESTSLSIAASAAAATATTAATAATAAAASATTAATAATAAAASASASAATALADSATALSNSATALSTATAAASDATNAVSTANTANANANAALNAVAASLQYVLVADVAAIPASPVDAYAIEIVDSTGIESFSPLANRPVSFVGDTGLSVRLQYSSSGSTWNWLGYYANDSETRYVKASGLASQAEAEAGASNTKWMSPLRVAQAIAALVPSGGSGVTAENDQAIVSDYTLATGKNASSVGPVSIDAGVTVTISANSTWVIF